MSNDLSHVYLPAHSVKKACNLTLSAIEQKRMEILTELAKPYMSRGRLFPKRKIQKALTMLTPEEQSIPSMHRALDEQVALKLRDLTSIALEQGDDFKVYVSADDFQSIKDCYTIRVAA